MIKRQKSSEHTKILKILFIFWKIYYNIRIIEIGVKKMDTVERVKIEVLYRIEEY